MEDNLILEGLLSMVTELKEKLEAQVTPASREETLERFGAIEQVLSRLHSNPAVPLEKLQAIQSQLTDIRNAEQEQQQSIGEVRKFVTATYRCLKEMLDVLDSYRKERTTEKAETEPTSLPRRISGLLRPKLFVFLAGLVICFVSLFLNIRLAGRMQQLQDNDMKYRYLLMQGQADGETFDMLENKFKWQRDNGFIRSLTKNYCSMPWKFLKYPNRIKWDKCLMDSVRRL